MTNHIRRHLTDNGWSVEEFSDRLGISRSMVYRWIAGQSVPHELRMQKVLAMLGASKGRSLRVDEVWPDYIVIQ